MDKNVNSWPPNFKGPMCQRGGENVDVYHFHRDPRGQNYMENVGNQPVFAENISEKQHFLGFKILHFQGNLTSLSQYGYYVVFFVLYALIWDIFNI